MKTVLLVLLLAGSYAGLGQVVMRSSGHTRNKQVSRERIVPPGAYDLAPDNMACVVPDMATVKPMPNSLKAGTKIQFMPNGYKGTNPVVVAVDKKTVQPKKPRK